MEVVDWIIRLTSCCFLFQMYIGYFSTEAAGSVFGASQQPTAGGRSFVEGRTSFDDAPVCVYFGAYDILNDRKTNRSRIEELVDLFASRFQYMSVLTTSVSSLLTDRIFRSVALHNVRNSLASTPRPIQIYSIATLDDTFTESFDTMVKLADTANEIYNGTVLYLILSNFYPSHSADMIRVNYATEKLNGTTLKYPVGLQMKVSHCDNELPEQIQQYPTISLLIFSIDWDEAFHINGVENALKEINVKITNCKEIFNMSHLNIRIGFEFTWLDTNSIGTFQNQSELVSFWKSMAELALTEDFDLFMHQAFDSITGDTGLIDSSGWWTSDSIEKMSRPTDGYRFPAGFQIKSSHCDWCCLTNQGVKYRRNNESDVSFNKTLVTVFLDVRLAGGVWTEKQFLPFVEIITDRFRKLSIVFADSDLNPRETKSSEFQFLKTVAWRNKIHTSCNKAPYTKTEVIIELTSTVVNANSTIVEVITLAHSIIKFSETLAQINQISADTVTTIILHVMSAGLTKLQWDLRKAQLTLIKTCLEGYNLNLGIVESASNMDDSLYREHWLENILPLVSVAYMKHEICQVNKGIRVFEDVSGTTKALEYMFAKHKRITEGLTSDIHPNIGIYLDLSESSCLNDHEVNRKVVANLWLKINKMAENRSIQIVIGPGIGTTQRTFAEWWEFADTGDYYVVKEFLGKYDEEDIQSISIWAWTGVIVSFVVIFTLVCLVWFFLGRRSRTQWGIFRQEELEFREGKTDTNTSDITVSENVTQHLAAAPYDVSVEIKSSNFLIDNSRIMGSGNFGSVCLGEVSLNGKKIWTAVKSLHCHSPKQAMCLRSLLMEIKILSYLRAHENITQLIGAYTSEINTGKVFVFLELCHHGSLHGYLRSKHSSSPIVTPDLSIYEHVSDPLESSREQQLLRWSVEIANGMEYISSKFIVHADLATRNVLLDIHKTAKICDFGLSRRMENYQNYVKSNNEPLPWRWMAYESLTALEFSTKSDVWSYGVTLWEIYNEGKLPYPGLTWTCGFTETLESGLRLPKPNAASQSLYSLMESCWNIVPNNRPDFGNISRILTGESFKLQNKVGNSSKPYVNISSNCDISPSNQTARYSHAPNNAKLYQNL